MEKFWYWEDAKAGGGGGIGTLKAAKDAVSLWDLLPDHVEKLVAETKSHVESAEKKCIKNACKVQQSLEVLAPSLQQAPASMFDEKDGSGRYARRLRKLKEMKFEDIVATPQHRDDARTFVGGAGSFVVAKSISEAAEAPIQDEELLKQKLVKAERTISEQVSSYTRTVDELEKWRRALSLLAQLAAENKAGLRSLAAAATTYLETALRERPGFKVGIVSQLVHLEKLTESLRNKVRSLKKDDVRGHNMQSEDFRTMIMSWATINM